MDENLKTFSSACFRSILGNFFLPERRTLLLIFLIEDAPLPIQAVVSKVLALDTMRSIKTWAIMVKAPICINRGRGGVLVSMVVTATVWQDECEVLEYCPLTPRVQKRNQSQVIFRHLLCYRWKPQHAVDALETERWRARRTVHPPTHTTFTPLTIFNNFDFLGGWVGFPFFPFFGVPFHFSRTFIIPLGVKMSRFFQIISILQLAVTVAHTATRWFTTLLQFSFSLRLP